VIVRQHKTLIKRRITGLQTMCRYLNQTRPLQDCTIWTGNKTGKIETCHMRGKQVVENIKLKHNFMSIIACRERQKIPIT
jgi:hypothetical protein